MIISYTQTITNWRPTSNHWLAKSHITLISADDYWHNWLEIVGSCTSHGSNIRSKPVSTTLPIGWYNCCRSFKVSPHKYRHWQKLLLITLRFKAKLANIVYSIPNSLCGGPIYPYKTVDIQLINTSTHPYHSWPYYTTTAFRWNGLRIFTGTTNWVNVQRR